MPLTLQTPPADAARKRRLVGLCCDAMQELDRACQKFPAFPDKLHDYSRMTTPLDMQLATARTWNDRDAGNRATGYSVFVEEFLEFVEAALRGERAAAEAELVQAMAMLMRIALHLDDYCPAQTATGKQQPAISNKQQATGNGQKREACRG